MPVTVHKSKALVARRPAETAGAAFGIAGVAAGIATQNWQAAVTAFLVGCVPAVWTFLKVNGGISGVAATLWRGARSS